MSKTTRKPRTWAPKCRAATHEDRRTKRQRTRRDRDQSEIEAELAEQTAQDQADGWYDLREQAEMDESHEFPS